MSLWGRIFAALYDPLMAGTEKAGLADQRRRLLESAHGQVLEIGAGTGANLPYYGEAVDELVLAEPEEPMARRLERKVAASNLRARVARAPAEALPFFERALEAGPRSSMALNGLALTRLALGDRPGAAAAFRESLKLDPHQPDVARTLGEIK